MIPAEGTSAPRPVLSPPSPGRDTGALLFTAEMYAVQLDHLAAVLGVGEPRARAMFLQARAQTYEDVVKTMRGFTPELTDAQIHQLATYAIAGADGLFIAKELGGDAVDLLALFELHAQALYDTALRMISEGADQ